MEEMKGGKGMERMWIDPYRLRRVPTPSDYCICAPSIYIFANCSLANKFYIIQTPKSVGKNQIWPIRFVYQYLLN